MSLDPEFISLAVVPTVVVPFALISVALSAVATFIAGLFGVQLHWEGPKRLLEVFLKPRVIVAAVLLNALFLGGYQAYRYLKDTPSFLYTVKKKNEKLLALYSGVGEARSYTDWTQRYNQDPAPWSASTIPPGKMRFVGLKQVWNARLPQGVFGAASLSGPSAFVGSDDGHVYELNRTDGAIVRKFFIGTEITPEPIIWNNLLFVGEGIHTTHHARIYSFDLKSGAFRGAFQTKGHTEGVPVVAVYQETPLLFVMAGSDGVYAVNPHTLEAKWHRNDLGHVDSEVRVVRDRVYLASGIEKGTIDRIHRAYSIDFLSGEIIWKAELSASGWMPPVIMETDVCFGVGEIYTESHFGQFACYDLKHGVPRLSINMDAPVMGIPFKTAGSVFMSDLQGQICAIHWPLGWRRWCHPTNQKSYASPTYDGKGFVAYPSAKEGLFVLDAETGTTVFQWKPQESEGAWGKAYARVTLDVDGAWYLTDLSGNVRKLQPEYESSEQQMKSPRNKQSK